MPTIQDVMQMIADYLEEHDKEDAAGDAPLFYCVFFWV
jgi:hypothetical protein